MVHRKLIELENDLVVHEFEYFGEAAPRLAANHMDVTSRTDGPFLGKVHDPDTDTFSFPTAPTE